MARKRRINKRREHVVTLEAVEAFKAGDWNRLHAALGLKPWQASPLDTDCADAAGTAWAESLELARELRAELRDAAARFEN